MHRTCRTVAFLAAVFTLAAGVLSPTRVYAASIPTSPALYQVVISGDTYNGSYRFSRSAEVAPKGV